MAERNIAAARRALIELAIRSEITSVGWHKGVLIVRTGKTILRHNCCGDFWCPQTFYAPGIEKELLPQADSVIVNV